MLPRPAGVSVSKSVVAALPLARYTYNTGSAARISIHVTSTQELQLFIASDLEVANAAELDDVTKSALASTDRMMPANRQ